MIRVKSRCALIQFVVVLAGLVLGGGILWRAVETQPGGPPPGLAFVAIAIAVVALLFKCR